MITNLKLLDELMIASMGMIWLGLVRWVYTDARRRIEHRKLIWLATLTAFVPVVGLLVYLLARPPDSLRDIRQRRLEMYALETRLRKLGTRICPHCDYELRAGFIRCPRCARRLKRPCPSCRHPLDLDWKICPFCEADVSSPATIPVDGIAWKVQSGTPTPRRRTWPPFQVLRLRSAARHRSPPRQRLDARR